MLGVQRKLLPFGEGSYCPLGKVIPDGSVLQAAISKRNTLAN